MGDIIYEGSRGIVPDYLKFLGASAVLVGLVSGLGEFIGYAVRILSGYLADVTKSYWLFTPIETPTDANVVNTQADALYFSIH